MDRERIYEDLKTIHPLMAGRYFPGDWELIPYEMPELVSEPEETTTAKIEEETEVITDDIDAGLGKSLAADETDNQGGKIAAKKSGRKKKANRKENTESDDSDCREYGTASETENESAEADT